MVVKEKVAGFDVAADCPKNMLNGPCGGVQNGMCEVGGPCVWVKVYSKLVSEGKLDDFTKVRMPGII
ncbi:MAG: methylenetetrahydrofolate reductase C-terminal domain-containing protein [Candidatus Altiarchaeota archaeon]